jgi:hypothetical protein
VTRNLSKIKFLMITILFWPVLALSSASTSATLSSSQTSSSSVQTAGCLTQITAFGTPNTGGDYASQCGAGQWCTSESTNAFSTLASTANGGLMCAGSYAVDFAGCEVYSAQSCGGGSCAWGATVTATTNAGSCGATQLASASHWMGTAGLSQSHYNPNENLPIFIYFGSFTYDTGMSNLVFHSQMNDSSNGTLSYCVISIHRTSTNVPMRQSLSCF